MYTPARDSDDPYSPDSDRLPIAFCMEGLAAEQVNIPLQIRAIQCRFWAVGPIGHSSHTSPI